jgi:hypothetical protein
MKQISVNTSRKVENGNTFKTLCLSIILLSMMASCSVTKTISVNKNFPDTISLNSNASVFIALPNNGSYNGRVYENSGRQTQSHLQYALANYAKNIIIGTNYEQEASAKATAKAQGAQYLFYPVITHWEDCATAWSGIPDRVAVWIKIYDVTSGQLLYNVELYSKSRAVTMVTTDPSNLLPDLFKDLMKKIYHE